MTMLLALMVLCLSGNALAAPIFEAGACPVIQAMSNFSVSDFMGEWHTATCNTMNSDVKIKCVNENMTLDENGTISVVGSTINCVSGIKVLVPSRLYTMDPTVPAKMMAKLLGPAVAGMYWVLDTDYVSYALVYSCISIHSQHFKMVWFYTRTQQASEFLMAKADELIDKYSFRKSSFHKIKQDECTLTPSE